MHRSIISLAALATAALTAATAAPALASSPAHIVNCAAQAQVRPSELTLFCADANVSLTHLRWSDWGRGTATATAVEVTNTCTPDCAAGRDVSHRVHVTVSALRDGRYRTLRVGASRFTLTAHGPVIT